MRSIRGGIAASDAPWHAAHFASKIAVTAEKDTVGASDADASDAPTVAFSAVTAIFEAKCAACHGASDAAMPPRIDLITAAGRYARLTTPLPNNQEGRC